MVLCFCFFSGYSFQLALHRHEAGLRRWHDLICLQFIAVTALSCVAIPEKVILPEV